MALVRPVVASGDYDGEFCGGGCTESCDLRSQHRV